MWNALEIHVIDTCNLKCRACSHWVPFATEANMKTPEGLTEIFSKINCPSIEPLFGQLNILGGEPLLNPKLPEIISVVRKFFPKINLQLYTNGSLLNEQTNKKVFQSLIENNCGITLSIHQPPGIAERTNFFTRQFLLRQGIPSNRIRGWPSNEFWHFKLKTRPPFKDNPSCPVKTRLGYWCNQLIGTNLYKCAICAYSTFLKKHFDKVPDIPKSDFIDLSKASLEEVKAFLVKPTLQFCGYCIRMPEDIRPYQNFDPKNRKDSLI